MKNKLLMTLAIVGLVGIATAGTIAAVNAYNKDNSQEETTTNRLVSDIESTRTLTIYKLNTGVDELNHEYQEFSVTTTPAYVRSISINVNITFADNRNPSGYLTSSVDNDNHIFRITCLQGFNSVATANVTVNGGASASVRLDYKQRLSGADWLNEVDFDYNVSSGSFIPGGSTDTHPDLLDIINTIRDGEKGYALSGSPAYTVEADIDEAEIVGAEPSNNPGHSLYMTGLVLDDGSYSADWFIDAFTNHYSLKDIDGTANPIWFNDDYGLVETPSHISDGFYRPLDEAWRLMTEAQKQRVADELDNNGDFVLKLDLSKANFYIYHPDYNGEDVDHPHIMKVNFDTVLRIHIQPYPGWSVGLSASTLTVSDDQHTF